MVSKTCRDVTLRVITPTLKPASGMAPDKCTALIFLTRINMCTKIKNDPIFLSDTQSSRPISHIASFALKTPFELQNKA